MPLLAYDDRLNCFNQCVPAFAHLVVTRCVQLWKLWVAIEEQSFVQYYYQNWNAINIELMQSQWLIYQFAGFLHQSSNCLFQQEDTLWAFDDKLESKYKIHSNWIGIVSSECRLSMHLSKFCKAWVLFRLLQPHKISSIIAPSCEIDKLKMCVECRLPHSSQECKRFCEG